jgi:hypothetical protein
MKRRVMFLALMASVIFAELLPAADSPAVAAPPTAKIVGLRRLDETIARLGGNGDNWQMTWTADDRMVAGLCDGDAQPWPNVPHRPFNSRLISIRGIPPQPQFADTPGYPELLTGPGPRNVSRYYGFGILAIDGSIYQFLSTPDRPFDITSPIRVLSAQN